jgi:Mg-chelatase subunit ChlD
LVSLNEIHEWQALWDKTISTVSIPESLTGAPLDNPSDPEITETACYSHLAESFMVEKYKSDEEYWAKYDVQPSWTYFGAHNGLFRKIPAVHQEECGDFDPRRRPWFVAASSGPKDVVLVLDISGSMEDNGRMDTAKAAAITIVETLTVADRFAVISFSSEASLVGGYSGLIRATNENKNQLVEAIKGLKPQGATNFYIGLETAFDALDGTIRNEATSGCNIAVLFMTDGQISVGPEIPGADEVISLVKERTEQLEADFGRKTTILTFSLGSDADDTVTKSIACSTNGIWTRVNDSYGDLISAMSSYYKLFALSLGEGDNEDFVAWVEPYADYTTGKMGTTVSVPVYDRTVNPPLFLGVAAIDSEMAAIEQVLGEDPTSSTMLERFVVRSTASCPKIELSECELDALRFLSGDKDATCGKCNSTSYAGFIPEKCPFQSDLPNDLWNNSKSK